MSYGKKLHPLGFWQVDPMPTEKELEKYYREAYFQVCERGAYSPDYTADELESFANTARVTEHIRNSLYGNARGGFLDVGCGEGYFAAYMHELGWDLDLVDFSSWAIENHHPSLLGYFRQGNIYDLLRDSVSSGNTYGLINVANVLEHVRDPLGLLDLIRGLMDRGSLLRVRVPNDYSGFQAFLLKKGFLDGETWFAPPDHLNYFTCSSLEKTLADCGFETVRVLVDFPVETYLVNQFSNYWADRSRGKQAHYSRIMIENFLVNQDMDSYIDYMAAAARCGFGRDTTAFVRLAG
ncbi:MAG: class I SAM-dependent methyltransferase [Nitrospirae bacterium]|nr:class I SAM-dependent methyltransferase [Nitrospirota bacterium]